MLFLGIILIAGLGYWKMWRDVSEGHLLKVLIIGGIAVLGGWRAYKQVQAFKRT